jgi:hypothetical protein
MQLDDKDVKVCFTVVFIFIFIFIQSVSVNDDGCITFPFPLTLCSLSCGPPLFPSDTQRHQQPHSSSPTALLRSYHPPKASESVVSPFLSPECHARCSAALAHFSVARDSISSLPWLSSVRITLSRLPKPRNPSYHLFFSLNTMLAVLRPFLVSQRHVAASVASHGSPPLVSPSLSSPKALESVVSSFLSP